MIRTTLGRPAAWVSPASHSKTSGDTQIGISITKATRSRRCNNLAVFDDEQDELDFKHSKDEFGQLRLNATG